MQSRSCNRLQASMALLSAFPCWRSDCRLDSGAARLLVCLECIHILHHIVRFLYFLSIASFSQESESTTRLLPKPSYPLRNSGLSASPFPPGVASSAEP